MSNWLEIDREIVKEGTEPICCFFEDDFQLSSKIKQIEHLPDTKEYLRCLERKLAKLKGTSKVSSDKSKEIIQSLIGIRQDTMSSFLANSNEPTDDLGDLAEIDDGDLKDASTVASNGNTSYLDKKIHPERQALTKEEQQLLIKCDFLALRTERAEPQDSTPLPCEPKIQPP